MACQEDAAGNIKLNKSRSSTKIDGLVATVMGIGRANATGVDTGSVYESQSLEIL